MDLKLFSMGVIASACLAVPAAAVTFTLDDFSTDQVASADDAGGNPVTSTVAGGGMSGIAAASRDFFADNTSPNSALLTTIQAIGGQLTFSNNATAQGTATVTYNTVDLQNTLADGFFFFDVGEFDDVADFSVFAEDGAGVTATYTELLAPTFDPVLMFTQLTYSDGVATAFDFSDVDTLAFTISSDGLFNNTDGVLNSIEVSAVPVPASGLLLLAGAGGLVAMRRRKSTVKA